MQTELKSSNLHWADGTAVKNVRRSEKECTRDVLWGRQEAINKKEEALRRSFRIERDEEEEEKEDIPQRGAVVGCGDEEGVKNDSTVYQHAKWSTWDFSPSATINQ